MDQQATATRQHIDSYPPRSQHSICKNWAARCPALCGFLPLPPAPSSSPPSSPLPIRRSWTIDCNSVLFLWHSGSIVLGGTKALIWLIILDSRPRVEHAALSAGWAKIEAFYIFMYDALFDLQMPPIWHYLTVQLDINFMINNWFLQKQVLHNWLLMPVGDNTVIAIQCRRYVSRLIYIQASVIM